MLTPTVLLIVAIIAGLYMAWNIGANDVANAMGTSVGSGAITLKQAIILAGIFEFAGAFFVGGNVSQTIRKGIVDLDKFRAGVTHAPIEPHRTAATQPTSHPALTGATTTQSSELDRRVGQRLAIGMLASLLAAAAWLNVATFFGQPVSTTHAIVGAVMGFAIVAAGPGAIVWSKMGAIAASWVISPVAGGLLAFVIYRMIQRFVLRYRHPVLRAKMAVPLGFGSVVFILTLSITYKVLHLGLDAFLLAVPVAMMAGALAGIIARAVLVRKTRNQRVRLGHRYQVVERWFARIQPVTACYVAFAHGANDVANAIGPLAGVVHYALHGPVGAKTPVPAWLLALGGLGIVLGLMTYGYKVIETIGRKLTEITPTRGFSAEFGTATTVLACSLLGLPISTTLVMVGAVMGVGLARGFAAIDMKVIRRIFASWIITIPASAVFAVIFYMILTSLSP